MGDTLTDNSKRGVYGKYVLEKADGSPVDPSATYFVLRLDSDPAARKAMRVYAEHCGNENLAYDILACVDSLERPPCGCREADCPHEPLFSGIWRHDEGARLAGISELPRLVREWEATATK